jgi:hypothetical protein
LVEDQRIGVYEIGDCQDKPYYDAHRLFRTTPARRRLRSR